MWKEGHQDPKTTRHWRSEEILAECCGARDQLSRGCPVDKEPTRGTQGYQWSGRTLQLKNSGST